MDALLGRAQNERWRIRDRGKGLEFLKTDLKLYPEGERLAEQPEDREYLRKEMERLFAVQQLEVESVARAIRLSPLIKFDAYGMVDVESVSAELRPLLRPRTWWPEFREAAQARQKEIETAASAAMARRSIVTPADAPTLREPMQAIVSVEMETPKPSVAESAAPSASSVGPVSPVPEQAPKEAKESHEPPQPASPSREEWAAMIEVVEEWGYAIVFDAVSGRYDAPNAPPEMRSVLFDSTHDEATQRKLTQFFEARAALREAREQAELLAMRIQQRASGEAQGY